MANKYDITSGLTEYKSMYHDVGVDKYIDAVQSLRETHDRNVAGANLVNEGVQQMEFMPGDDQAGRTYLASNVNNILQGAMDAPEEASMQVNKAAQFFTSDPTASAYRRNAKEYALTKQVAMNTPGGWSSMIMFGNNPLEFQTMNEDGSANQYVHQAETRLDQEGKFLDIVGTIAKDTKLYGPAFQDIDGDGINDIMATGSSTGVSDRRADQIVDGVMEQYITTAEGKQAMRELMESVSGNAPVTQDREEAKRMLTARLRPLIQNQVGSTRTQSSSQLTSGKGNQGSSSIYGTDPSMLLSAIRNQTKTFGVEQLTELGMGTGTVASTGRILNDYASLTNLGFLKDVSSDFEISPGFKPFEDLDEYESTKVTEALMQVIALNQEGGGSPQEASKIAATIPGFTEAMKENPDAVTAGLQRYYKAVSAISQDELQQSLGVLLKMEINGGIHVNRNDGAKVKTINRNGETKVAVQNRMFVTTNQLNLMSRQDGNIGTIGSGIDFFKTDINNIKHPRTKKPLFTPGEYQGEEGYYVDTWTELDVNLSNQQAIDGASTSESDAAKKQPGWAAQIEGYGNLVGNFQMRKAQYLQDGIITYNIGTETRDGVTIPKTDKMNIGKYINVKTAGGAVIDQKIRQIFDIMPEVIVEKQRITPGINAELLTNNINTQIRFIVSTKEDDKLKATKLQNLINGLRAITK